MKRTAAVIGTIVVAFALTACNSGYATNIEQIKEQAAFVKACEEAGGKASYNGVPQQICVFDSTEGTDK